MMPCKSFFQLRAAGFSTHNQAPHPKYSTRRLPVGGVYVKDSSILSWEKLPAFGVKSGESNARWREKEAETVWGLKRIKADCRAPFLRSGRRGLAKTNQAP